MCGLSGPSLGHIWLYCNSPGKIPQTPTLWADSNPTPAGWQYGALIIKLLKRQCLNCCNEDNSSNFTNSQSMYSVQISEDKYIVHWPMRSWVFSFLWINYCIYVNSTVYTMMLCIIQAARLIDLAVLQRLLLDKIQ